MEALGNCPVCPSLNLALDRVTVECTFTTQQPSVTLNLHNFDMLYVQDL